MPSLICDTDILVLTLPLTNETRGIIGDSEMANMHERSILVNVGRGALVDEDSLYEHLRRGSIGAAGIDVWYRYPSSPSDYSCTRPSRRDFENLANLVMTPHLGGAFGAEKLESLRLECLAKSIKEVAEGREMPFRVNLELGY
jgi:phosphoglycerate dehydrogenase-like enzyme